MHWLNALAIIAMIGSGWKIYNDEEIFGWLRFPDWATLGGDPGLSVELRGNGGYSGALLWHFAGMWLLVLNGLAYLGYGFATRRFRERLLPLHPREVLRDLGRALRLRLHHDDITMYNSVQKLLYVGVILAAAVQVTSGLAMWKPMQLWWLAALFGDFQAARLAHFMGMSAIVLFLLIHVALALLVPRTLLAMITGGPRMGNRRAPGTALPGAGP
jgi:thiosulfate reductase cytochrome b subunit